MDFKKGRKKNISGNVTNQIKIYICQCDIILTGKVVFY